MQNHSVAGFRHEDRILPAPERNTSDLSPWSEKSNLSSSFFQYKINRGIWPVKPWSLQIDPCNGKPSTSFFYKPVFSGFIRQKHHQWNTFETTTIVKCSLRTLWLTTILIGASDNEAVPECTKGLGGKLVTSAHRSSFWVWRHDDELG